MLARALAECGILQSCPCSTLVILQDVISTAHHPSSTSYSTELGILGEDSAQAIGASCFPECFYKHWLVQLSPMSCPQLTSLIDAVLQAPLSLVSPIADLSACYLMPPPHLHPRSRMTSSLFATTILASFFVVALPHVLPCPAPRGVFADGEMPDGTKRRRRRRSENLEAKDGIVDFNSVTAGDEASTAKASMPKRECPVPRPGGRIGELLGFKGPEDGSGSKPER